MRTRVLILTWLVAGTFALGGCSVVNTVKEKAQDAYETMFDAEDKSTGISNEDTTPIIKLNRRAADGLYHYVSEASELPEGSPIYVRNFTNEVDPTDTSRFGRIVANQVANRLAQHELRITDGAPPADAALPPPPPPVEEKPATGAALPFSQKKLPPRAAMLIGTYFIGDTLIYLNAKIVRLDDNAVVSGKDWTLPVNDNTRELLPQMKQHDAGMQPAVRDQF